MKSKTKQTTVLARCVACQAKREIKPGEIKPGDHPMCTQCFSPMVPVAAK